MAGVQTTIKTELCSFSEYRIYPGRGLKFVSRDGKVHTYIHSKEARLGRQKKKAAKLRWTLVWRRANKKIRGEAVAKRRTRKGGKVQKAIVGISLEEIKQRRAAKPDPTKMRKMPAKEKKEKKEKPKQTVVPGTRAPPVKKMVPRAQKVAAARLM
ncbi:60S ribosomal protein L24, putative [Eimeria necatrix]|uniref:60S ribosomal protein L24, putative n=1 Tax=Eimeria necatrix TaxID=51315 RepID=U6N2T2_9EIME|nr:60S ribosomal protein L24, putative [Eimeria necatrix]CDJ68260.1 60S ribosomal protein L24, putative [Eimeria necatrix]